MHAWIRRALCAVGLVGGIVVLGIGLAEAASADDDSGPVTTGESGILSGNQTAVDAHAPVNVSGNQVTVIGQDNTSSSQGGSATANGAGTTTGDWTTSGANGVLSGNQTGIDVVAPINASGNQATVVGQDNTLTATGGSAAPTGSTGPGATTTGEGGLGSGNQTPVGVQAPVDVSGNQVTVVGQDNTDSSTGGSTSGGPGGGGGTTPPGTGTVSPPTGGGSGPQAGPSPSAGVLPSTGAPSGVVGIAMAGLLLLLAGGLLCRREVGLTSAR